MSEQDVIALLNVIAEYESQADSLRLQKEEALKAAIPADVQTRLNEIEAELGGKAAVAAEKVEDIKTQVRELVLALGYSVKGDHLHAVFVSGRTTWDNKKMVAMLKRYPELESAKKEGDPSVSFRGVK